MKKKTTRKIVFRASAGVLAAAVAVSTFVMNGVSVEAKTSLGQIETIKSTQSIFNILEIVPEDGTGSIGYYAENQEPVADWQTKLGTIEGKEDRTSYAEELFANLEKRGLLSDAPEDGSEPSTPLTKNADYAETYPWETLEGSSLIALTDDYGSSRYEEVTLENTTFTYKGANKGSFSLISTPELVGTGAGGYSQNVAYFVATTDGTESAENTYYYDPVFEEVDQESEESFKDEKLYTQEIREDGTVYYLYWGVASSDKRMDGDTRYFKITSYGDPHVLTNETISEEVTGTYYTCSSCDEVFRSEDEFNAHVNAMNNASYSETTVKHTYYVCGECTEVFDDYDEAVDHYLDQHADQIATVTDEDGNVTYQCLIDDETYTSRDEIAVHIFVQGHCYEDTTYTYTYKCDVCGETFDEAESAEEHAAEHQSSHTDAAVTSEERTSTETYTKYYYQAVLDENSPYYEDENGRFLLIESCYAYAGENKGDYDIAEASGESHTVRYSEIKATGGWTNNEWFLKHVFDIEDLTGDEIEIRVITKTPSELTDTRVNELLEAVDMVVVSSGYDISTGVSCVSEYTQSNDLSADSVTAILNAVADNDMPLLIDSYIRNAKYTDEDGKEQSLNIAGIAKDYQTSTSSVINESEYFFVADLVRENIATKAFITEFNKEVAGNDYTDTSSAYNVVYKELNYENFLRRTADADTKDLLDETVDMAACVRYIINFGGQRVENHKTKVRILDIEPMPTNDKAMTNSDTTDDYLTKKKVLNNWLKDSGLTEDDITITTMSTAELIGKIENINENYDMIYIGASTYNFNMSNGEPVYNDSTMNGLYYSNIGDTYTAKSEFLGLVDADFAGEGVLSRTTTTARFSGNDITETKADELKVFAQTGLPIIIADTLMNNEHAETNATLTVTASGSVSTATEKVYSGRYGSQTKTKYTVTMTAAPQTNPTVSGLTYHYSWYKVGSSKVIGTEKTYSYSVYDDLDTSSQYYCVVTAVIDGSSVSATSNYLKFGSSLQVETSGSDDSIESSPVIPVTCETWGYNYGYYFEVAYYKLIADLSGIDENQIDSIQWYRYEYISSRKNSGYYAFKAVSGENSNEIKVNSGITDTYICEITMNDGTVYYSEGAKYSRGNSSYGNTSLSDYSLIKGNKQVTVSTSKGTSKSINSWATVNSDTSITLSASVSSGSAKFDWYNQDSYGWSREGSSITVSEAGTYYCKVTINNHAYYTKYFIVAKEGTSLVDAGGGADGVVYAPATSYSINTSRIDNCSVLYETLSSFYTRQNVMSETEATEQNSLLLRYLNLSSPSIEFSDAADAKPADYRDNATTVNNATTNLSNTLVQNNELKYIFSISNPTDATPTMTSYTVKLYVDSNGDGKYADGEQLDIEVYDSDNNWIEPDELKESTTYTVERILPDTLTGVIPWKLVVEVNGKDGLVDSEIGYTYKKPSRTKINILQIRQDDYVEYDSWGRVKSTSYSLDLAWSIDSNGNVVKHDHTNSTYAGYFKDMYDAGIYEMNITSKTITEINEFTADAFGYASLDAYLQSFDMLIIGFGDCYGNFNAATARAVVDFINTDKAILFTHDTTSFHNLGADFKVRNSSTTVNDASNWGYEFNTILRDAVSLDRYGVTNSEFGQTKYGIRTDKTTSGTVASAYADLDNELAKQILTSGYSIAYDANSYDAATDTKQTTGETQGYTNYELVRYSANTNQKSFASNATISDSTRTVTTVSKVNDGQITMYPYILSDDTLNIKSTHDQYYQLNMNSNDIVVWYCLSGGVYDEAGHNDVVNGYYIYNCGNVTYSGAGHTGDDVAQEEAQLFVNTMVAAYRAGAESPKISFEDSTGKSEVTQQSVAVEYSNDATTSTLQQSVLDEGVKVYFKISDPNLTSEKTISLSFSYIVDGTTYSDETVIYNAKTGEAAYDYYNEVLYYIEIPENVLNAFSASDDTELKINGAVSTVIGGATYTGTNVMSIHKLGLLSLR